jgi:hypothetical protein
VDAVEIFVEVDSVGCMSGGGGERNHEEVGDCTVRESKIPSPPALRLSCAMRRA